MKSKEITFNIVSPEDAVRYMEDNNNYFRVASLHIPENRNASSATSEQRSASNRMNNYIAIMMAGSYLAHSSPDGKRVQPVGE